MSLTAVPRIVRVGQIMPSGVPTFSAAVATTWQMLKKLQLPAQIPNCGERPSCAS